MPNSPRSPPPLPCPPQGVVRVSEVLAFPAVQLLDVAGPLQVFASANDLVARASTESGESPPYALRVVAEGRHGVTASAGLGLGAGPLPPIGSPLDTLMVAGGRGVEAAAADPALVDWVRHRARQARRVASVCTGVSCWLPQACWMAGGRQPTGHCALNSPGASPPCVSSRIRSSCATARFGARPG